MTLRSISQEKIKKKSQKTGKMLCGRLLPTYCFPFWRVCFPPFENLYFFLFEPKNSFPLWVFIDVSRRRDLISRGGFSRGSDAAYSKPHKKRKPATNPRQNM
jgi:hypothetical protein